MLRAASANPSKEENHLVLRSSSPAFFSLLLASLAAVLLVSLVAPTEALAQDGAYEGAPGTGTISGRVFDGESGAPLGGATVVLTFPEPGEDGQPKQSIATSGPDGDFEFDAVAAGAYGLSFVKSGYRVSSMKDFNVVAGQDNVAQFPMPRVAQLGGGAGGSGGDVMQLDEFVVDASVVGDMMDGLELRLESDQMLNLLSAEDLSKYAASDVADALKRVAGVNIVEGQFAVVRGLEDRYSSTLFNGAPVPSPDPDSQSVQLDLFPSDVVTNLVVAKTFGAESPSNSSAGSINILTQDYPEELTFKVSLGAGFEEGALDRFIEFEEGSTAGSEAEGADLTETDVTASFGGRYPLPFIDRELRFKAVVNHEIDYRTAAGFQEGREPRVSRAIPLGGVITTLRSGALAFGQLDLSDGLFKQTTSQRDEQLTASFGFGIDLDEEERHRIDFSAFYTKKNQETVELRENGFFTDLDYGPLIELTLDGDEDELEFGLQQLEGNDPLSPNAVATPGSRLAGVNSRLRAQFDNNQGRGALWFNSFGRTNSFERERDLQVYQFNGEHEFDFFEGLEVSWAANHARTTQTDSSRGMRFFFEPCGYAGIACPAGVSIAPIPQQFPVTVESLGPGNYFASGASGGIVFSDNDIKESQWFGKVDFDQSLSPFSFVDINLKGGVWWEKARRGVESLFIDSVTINGSSQWFIPSPSLQDLGDNLFDQFDSASGQRVATTRSSRELTAGHLTLKSTFWELVDVVGGVRLEQINITSENDPFTGEESFGRPVTFPPAYLFFDRVDSPEEGAASVSADRAFNDEILGIDVPIDPVTGQVNLRTREEILSVVNGEIDEFKVLPSVGISYRPLDGLTLRASYSQTVARPSFREMGYYVTVAPGTDDRVVGNPQLQLSDVTSVDFRTEYVYGDLGDLFAFSAFYKSIDDPIESIVLRNPLDFTSGSEALYRTFFNNQNTARLWGIEVEARKSFDFVRLLGIDFPWIEALDYLSIGGNFSYIEAKVGRSSAEIDRAREFFLLRDGDVGQYTGLESNRRLFGQPEWIANADISFDHPDWGTTVTLALFAISDVLDAAGSVALGPDGLGRSLTLDRYLDSFYQLDLVAAQRIWGGLKAKVSVKNLTDTRRRRIYDQEQTNQKYTERDRRFGRDWSFSLSYEYTF